jgi:predicted acyltransferase
MKTSPKPRKAPPKSELHTGWHGVPAVPLAERLPSLDAFRGFVIVAMVFVNNLGEGVPLWMRHADEAYPNTFDAYTFVDLVFPGFLFMVGFSIPLSFYSKVNQGVERAKLFWRVTARAAMLLLMGLIMVNHGYNEQLVGMTKPVYHSLIYVALILVNLATPKHWNELGTKILGYAKIISALLLAYLLLIYRAVGPDGQPHWFEISWWGILGLIGWAYLGAGFLYLAVKGERAVLVLLLLPLMGVDMASRHGYLGWLGSWREFNDAFGTHAMIVMAGAVLGSLFVGKEKITPFKRMLFILVFGASLFALGSFLRPLDGINKNAATVPWGLVSAGICCALYLFFYWVIEVLKARTMADDVLILVGQNALFAYLISNVNHDFYFVLMGSPMPYWGPYLNAFQQIGIVCIFSWICTKQKLFLRL